MTELDDLDSVGFIKGRPVFISITIDQRESFDTYDERKSNLDELMLLVNTYNEEAPHGAGGLFLAN